MMVMTFDVAMESAAYNEGVVLDDTLQREVGDHNEVVVDLELSNKEEVVQCNVAEVVDHLADEVVVVRTVNKWKELPFG